MNALILGLLYFFEVLQFDLQLQLTHLLHLQEKFLFRQQNFYPVSTTTVEISVSDRDYVGAHKIVKWRICVPLYPGAGLVC